MESHSNETESPLQIKSSTSGSIGSNRLSSSGYISASTSGSAEGRDIPRASVYEKLNDLSIEIIHGIRSMREDEEEDEDFDAQIKNMRESSYKERSPEAAFVTFLYRKFASRAQEKVMKLRKNGGNNINDNNLLRRDFLKTLPSYIYEGTANELPGGMESMKKNIFFLRATTVLFSFICYVVMATVPNINDDKLEPQNALLSSCPYNKSDVSGSFDMSPYQALIAFSVLVYIHSLLFVVYYLLPMDSDGNKHIPGLDVLFERISMGRVSGNQVKTHSTMVSSFCKSFSKYIEALVDALLLLMLGLTCLICSISVDRGTKFDFSGTIQYYTISTFYMTFSRTIPECVSDASTGDKIRASLAMCYLTLFVMSLTLIVSIKSLKLKLNESGAAGSNSRGSNGLESSHAINRQMHTLLPSGEEIDDATVVEVSL